jgi:hypothetical protein
LRNLALAKALPSVREKQAMDKSVYEARWLLAPLLGAFLGVAIISVLLG